VDVTEPGRPLVAIGGTPGTGKTAVSLELGRLLGLPVLHINELVRVGGLGRGRRGGAVVVDEAGLGGALGAIGEPSVVEGHLADLCPRARVTRLVVLRCRPAELMERLLARGYAPEKVQENVLAEGLDVCLGDALGSQEAGRVWEADTSGRGAGEVARELACALSGRLRLAPPGGLDLLEEALAALEGAGLLRPEALTRRRPRTTRPRRPRSGGP
jgi:broad-specificity NMP kinase